MLNLIRHIDFVQNIVQASDLAACEALIFEEFAKNEVTSIYYGCVSSLSDFDHLPATQAIYGISNHPDDWFDGLGVENCLDNDLTTFLCASAQDTILWHDETQWEEATEAEKEQAVFENEIGLQAGVTMPLLAPNQQNVAMIGLSMSDVKTQDFDIYWREKQPTVSEIGQLTNMIVQDRFMNEICDDIDLTLRCQEFLKFCAHGYSYRQIALKMHTSEANINQIARQSVRQLKARNVTNAVFKAVSLKILPL